MKKTIARFLSFLPVTYQNQLKSIYYNRNNNKRFNIKFKRGIWQINIDSETLYFLENPFYVFQDLHYYFRKAKLKKGDIVLDAGAFIGTFSIWAAKLVGNEGTVIAIEPDEKNFRQLQQNIKINNLHNVIAINKGLWEFNGTLLFAPNQSVSSSFISGETDSRSIQVPVDTIDNIVAEFKLHKLNFIKMDIEGAEIKAIIGAKDTLARQAVQLAIASYHIVDNEQTYLKLEQILKQYGYIVVTECISETITYAGK